MFKRKKETRKNLDPPPLLAIQQAKTIRNFNKPFE